MMTSTFTQHSVQHSPPFFKLANSLGTIGLSSHISRNFPVDPFDSQATAMLCFTSLLRTAGINPEGFSGHSFRRGAANSALQAGISRPDIMKMGRWKSDAMDHYFSSTTNTKNLLALSKQLHWPLDFYRLLYQRSSPHPTSQHLLTHSAA